MIAAIQNQKINKRRRTGLAGMGATASKLLVTDPIVPPPDYDQAAPGHNQTPAGNQRKKKKFKAAALFPSLSRSEEEGEKIRPPGPWQILIILVLLGLCSLLLLAVKLESLPLGPGWSVYELPLPEDFTLEAAMFGYAVSDDVRPGQEGENNLADAVIAGLQISDHVVGQGESISTIAQRYKLNMDTIISYNNIENAKNLRAGTSLAIPSLDGLKYKVRRGDNLSNIARKYQISLNTLLDWNNIDSSIIHPGTEYFIPGARLSRNELNLALGILFRQPVSGRLSSGFGWRSDPFSGKRRFHNGIDLVNNRGTVIRAAMDGQVVQASYNNIYGRYIIIRHNDGFQTLYGHLDSLGVRNRQWVKQGERIGVMGNTGYSTGTHLHFSIFRNGEPVNPYNYLN